jgi:predicted naringenin-chalcone synthase
MSKPIGMVGKSNVESFLCRDVCQGWTLVDVSNFHVHPGVCRVVDQSADASSALGRRLAHGVRPHGLKTERMAAKIRTGTWITVLP